MAKTKKPELARSGTARPADTSESPPAVREALWDDFFEAPGIDLGERDQPIQQDREAF